jgi:hypothetical protein
MQELGEKLHIHIIGRHYENYHAPLLHIDTLAIDDGTQSSSKQAPPGRLEMQARCDAVGMRGTEQHLFPNQP